MTSKGVPAVVLSQSPARYVREARLVRGAQGPELHVLAWWPDTQREAHLALEVGLEPLALGPERVVAEGRALEALAWSDVPRVVSGTVRDDAEAGAERVTIDRGTGRSRVVLHRAETDVVVWDA